MDVYGQWQLQPHCGSIDHPVHLKGAHKSWSELPGLHLQQEVLRPRAKPNVRTDKMVQGSALICHENRHARRG